MAGGFVRAARAAALIALHRLSRRHFRHREARPRVLDYRGRPVSIARDGRGLPTIEAGDEEALYFGQGHAMATDRLWQLDLLRRQASGRLSELFGSATVEMDVYHRTLALESFAAQSAAMLDPRSRRLLSAFADGINSASAEMKSTLRLPVEFALLGARPLPWRPQDSCLIVKLMSLQLSMNATYKILTHELLRRFPAEAVEALAGRQEAGDFVTLGHGKAGREWRIPVETVRPDLDLSGLLRFFKPIEAAGSNAWVAAGRHTADGSPILANDPHLAFGLPALFHQSRLRCTDPVAGFEAAGVNVPGVPGFISGHNEDSAWGITNAQVDVQDIVILEPDTGPGPFEARAWSEELTVKGDEPRRVEVRVTPFGPGLGQLCEPPPSGAEVALAWSGLPPAADIQGLFAMAKARDWTQFRSGLEHLQSLSLNFLFASRSGDIAFKTAGRVPLRPDGPRHGPSLHGWTGYVPFGELPEILNPPGGIIVNANNPIGGPADRPLTMLWNPSYRAHRISECLEGRSGLTLADMAGIQADMLNLHARELLPTLLDAMRPHHCAGDPAVDHAIGLLERWDHRDSEDSPASALWHRTYDHLCRRILGEEFGPLRPYFENERAAIGRLVRQAVAGVPSPWIRDPAGLGPLALAAVADAAASLGETAGWKRWGEHRRLGFRHPLSRALGPLGRGFDVAGQPRGGSLTTVSLNAGDREVGFGAVWSLVAGFRGAASVAHSTLLPGQSGDWRSRWYCDQFADAPRSGGAGVATSTLAGASSSRRAAAPPGKPVPTPALAFAGTLATPNFLNPDRKHGPN
jgi:penicillin amidase